MGNQCGIGIKSVNLDLKEPEEEIAALESWLWYPISAEVPPYLNSVVPKYHPQISRNIHTWRPQPSFHVISYLNVCSLLSCMISEDFFFVKHLRMLTFHPSLLFATSKRIPSIFVWLIFSFMFLPSFLDWVVTTRGCHLPVTVINALVCNYN